MPPLLPAGRRPDSVLLSLASSVYRPICLLAQLPLLGPDSPASLHARRRRLLIVVVGGDEDVVDADVDLGDLEAGHPLDRGDDVATDRLGEVGDGDAVLDDDVEVDRRLALAHLDGDALGDVRAAGARDALAKGAEGAGAAGAEVVHPVHLTGGDAGDLADDAVGDRGLALGGHQLGAGAGAGLGTGAGAGELTGAGGGAAAGLGGGAAHSAISSDRGK